MDLLQKNGFAVLQSQAYRYLQEKHVYGLFRVSLNHYLQVSLNYWYDGENPFKKIVVTIWSEESAEGLVSCNGPIGRTAQLIFTEEDWAPQQCIVHGVNDDLDDDHHKQHHRWRRPWSSHRCLLHKITI